MKRQVRKHFLKLLYQILQKKLLRRFFVLTYHCASHLCFKELGNPLPSEEKCRSKVEKLAEVEALRFKDYLKDQEMFMSDINGNF